MTTFIPTRSNNPCPICTDTTGKCRETAHVQLCMTIADGMQHIPGFRFIGRTKNDLWGKWIPQKNHSHVPPSPTPLTAQPQRRLQPINTLTATDRDRLYRQIFETLSLHPDDRADLNRRGLTDEQINRWDVRSVQQWQPLVARMPSNLPGVHTNGRSLNTFTDGYLCPIRDFAGNIVACQIRSRRPDDKTPKYYWLTSKTQKNQHGATAHLHTGELPLSIHRPMQCNRAAIALVEGTGVKPFLTAERCSVNTIGAAGGQFSSSPMALKTALEQLAASTNHPTNQDTSGHIHKVIEFYPDAGAVSNAHVLRQYRSTWALLKKFGFTVQIMWWNQLTKASPDIDELEDLSRIQTITIEEFEAIARHPKRVLQQISSLLGIKPTHRNRHSNPNQKPKRRQNTNLHLYPQGTRIQTWQQAIDNGYRYILDSSATGTGKSFDTGTLRPSDLNEVQAIIYLSDQHRNPTVETLSKQNGWSDLEARHAGLTKELSPKGDIRIRRARRGETGTIQANCSRTQTIQTLQEKNITGPEMTAIICSACPLQERCVQAQGRGYGFLNQRREILTSKKFRAHPDSLPSPDAYRYDDKLIIWDEPGQTFNIRHDIHVTLKDLEQTIAVLFKYEHVFESVKSLLAKLVPHLDGTTSGTKFGLTHEQIINTLPNVESVDAEDVRAVLTTNLDFLDRATETYEWPIGSADSTDEISPLVSATIDEAIANHTVKKVVKNWLPELITVLQGKQPGALSLRHEKLTISLLSNQHRAMVNHAKATIFLDATLNKADLALKLQCSETDIYEIQQVQEQLENLTIIQVTDIGRMGMQRGQAQRQRANIVIDHYKKTDSSTKVIDFKKNQADGAWWRDSRGINDFDQVKTLILVGTPCRNIMDHAVEFQLLNGCSERMDADSFQTYVNRVIEADIKQAIGRIRSHQREHEALTVILISNFEMEIGQKKVIASDITKKAATKREKFITAALHGICILEKKGEKVTQTSVAKLTGYSQQYISRFWVLLQTLLEELKSKCSNDLIKHTRTSISQNVCNLREGTAQRIGFSSLNNNPWLLEAKGCQRSNKIQLLNLEAT